MHQIDAEGAFGSEDEPFLGALAKTEMQILKEHEIAEVMASMPSDALEVKTELTAPVDAECQQVSPSVPSKPMRPAA